MCEWWVVKNFFEEILSFEKKYHHHHHHNKNIMKEETRGLNVSFVTTKNHVRYIVISTLFRSRRCFSFDQGDSFLSIKEILFFRSRRCFSTQNKNRRNRIKVSQSVLICMYIWFDWIYTVTSWLTAFLILSFV